MPDTDFEPSQDPALRAGYIVQVGPGRLGMEPAYKATITDPDTGDTLATCTAYSEAYARKGAWENASRAIKNRQAPEMRERRARLEAQKHAIEQRKFEIAEADRAALRLFRYAQSDRLDTHLVRS
jgi:acyl-CoA reductase-like NAD-dependent aldehyde dehydrogenase